MTKVITYGTYDLLHYGHIRLLERARALGDYLIVGVTADDFDKTRGKINVQQSLMERIEGVRATGLADEIIVEEYEGQKIDDIKRYNVDIFTVGSDWKGKFDYLSQYCKVVYLDRTEGISSSEIRAEKNKVWLGVVGDSIVAEKFIAECAFVNGIERAGIYTKNKVLEERLKKTGIKAYKSYGELLEKTDAVYIASEPSLHYSQIKEALEKKRHVIVESPIALSVDKLKELKALAHDNDCILMDAIKTAYSTAYSRLILMAKTGKIGDIVSVDATSTSLRDINLINEDQFDNTWNSICDWGPITLLPVFHLLGTDYRSKRIASRLINREKSFDSFSKIDFLYKNAVATVKTGKGVKSEGELIISGTKGYIYVPAPWWKTDYFEIRYEDLNENKRYFYQLDGEGIRYEIVAFLREIENHNGYTHVDEKITEEIVRVIEDFYRRKDFNEII